MKNLFADFDLIFDNWVLSVLIVTLTIFAASSLRWTLGRLAKSRHFALLYELAPAISYLVYVAGLKMAIDAAPIHPKLSLWLQDGFYITGALVVLWIVRRAAMLGIEWSSVRSSHSTTLQLGFIPLLKNLITLFVFFMGSIMILKHFNYDVLSLLTALGVGSLAVGLAAKDTLSNMISGFVLIIDRNLRAGDRIKLNDLTGDVEEIGLRSTRLKTGNGNILIIPNQDMVNTKILNLSLPSRNLAVTSNFRVPISVPFETIRTLCFEIIDGMEKAMPERGRWVNLASLNDGVQQISAGFWIADLDQEGGALSEFHMELLKRLELQKIILPLSSLLNLQNR